MIKIVAKHPIPIKALLALFNFSSVVVLSMEIYLINYEVRAKTQKALRQRHLLRDTHNSFEIWLIAEILDRRPSVQRWDLVPCLIKIRFRRLLSCNYVVPPKQLKRKQALTDIHVFISACLFRERFVNAWYYIKANLRLVFNLKRIKAGNLKDILGWKKAFSKLREF